MLSEIQQIAQYSKNIKILYVENDPIALENTLEFLETIFDNIITAVDGVDGLKKFKENKIDLVITNIEIPKLNGVEMIQKIKNIDKFCHTIILSEHNEVDFLLKSIHLNVDGYIFKPLDFDKMLDTLEKVIAKLKFEYEAKNYKYYLEQYLTLIDKSNIISKTDIDGTITYVNDSFCKISGYKREDIVGQKHSITRHHENTDEIYKEMWNSIKIKEEPWEGVVKNKSKSGTSYYVHTIITPIKDIDGKVVEYVAVRDSLNAVIDDKKFLFE